MSRSLQLNGSRGKRGFFALAAALGLLVVGPACDSGPIDVSERAAADGGTLPGPSLTAPTPRRGRVLGGERVDRIIEWPGERPAELPASELVGDMQPRSSEAIERSPVPVLVPPSMSEGASVMVGPSWFAFSGKQADLTVTVQGSSRAFVYPHIRAAEPTHTIRGRGGYLTRNEGIWVASWIEHGAAYSLELECATPFQGACADESMILALADELVFVGGAGPRDGGPR